MPDLRLTDPNTESTSAREPRGQTAASSRHHPHNHEHSHEHDHDPRIIMITTKAGSNGRG